MSQAGASRAERARQLRGLSTDELLKLYNENVGSPAGTVEQKGVPKEGMIRSILLKEGYGEEEYTPD